MSVKFEAEGVEVTSEIAAKVARIADLNDIEREAKAEGKRLKAEVVEVVGGPEMVAVFPEGIRITHEGTALASVTPQTRVTITEERLAAQIAALVNSNPEVSQAFPEFVAAVEALTTTAAKSTTFPVVRTK